MDVQLRDAKARVLVDKIPCKIYLPGSPEEMPYLSFMPQTSVMDLTEVAPFAMRGFREYGNGQSDELTSDEIIPVNVSERMGGHLFDRSMDGVPLQLRRVHQIANDRPGSSYARFHFSPNSVVMPHRIVARHENGATEVRTLDTDWFDLDENLRLRFDCHVRSKDVRNKTVNETVLRDELIGIVDSALSLDWRSIERDSLQLVDDFLLVVSLITDTRTGCLGWHYVDANQIVDVYRGNFGFPTGEPNNRFDRGVRGKTSSIVDLIRDAWRAFQNSDDKSLVRKAIWILVPGSEHHSAATYLEKFAIFEGLLLSAAKRNRREGLLASEQWTTFLDGLKVQAWNALSGFTLQGKEDLRRIFYERLNGLNRPTFRQLYLGFCDETAKWDSDIWPMFGNEALPGLYQVRNYLTHGYRISASIEDALTCAERNLHWLVTRVLLVYLGIDIRSTTLAFNYESESMLSKDRVERSRRRIAEF